MCGICGQLRFDHQTVNSQTIKSMMSKIERRGPDDSGSWINGSIGFGHQRLSIIDLSKNGSQPMIDRELDLTLVFNGTIYNYQLLRTELIKKGYRFFSESDSEVILKSYHLWGQDVSRNLMACLHLPFGTPARVCFFWLVTEWE